MQRLLGVFLLATTLSVGVATAQEAKPQFLVMEGGGIRGIAYGGAIDELQSQGKLDELKEVGGTSAGAIIAAALAVGYTGEEISTIMSTLKFQQFNDGIFGGIRLFKRWGWYKGQRFQKYIGEVIAVKTGDADITLGELKQKGFLPLSVTVTLMEEQRTMVVNANNYPGLKVADALRLTMSIPIYFEPMQLAPNGELKRIREKCIDCKVALDGGVIANYPIDMFDSVDQNSGKRIPNLKILGLRVDRDNQVKLDADSREIAPYPIEGFPDFMGAFYNLVIEKLNRNDLTEADWQRTISISDAGVGPKLKRMKAAEVNGLLEAGRNAVKAYYIAE